MKSTLIYSISISFVLLIIYSNPLAVHFHTTGSSPVMSFLNQSSPVMPFLNQKNDTVLLNFYGFSIMTRPWSFYHTKIPWNNTGSWKISLQKIKSLSIINKRYKKYNKISHKHNHSITDTVFSRNSASTIDSFPVHLVKIQPNMWQCSSSLALF